jgi:hypothetical protein
MKIMKQVLYDLLGKSLFGLSRVALVRDDTSLELDHTLVFEVEQAARYGLYKKPDVLMSLHEVSALKHLRAGFPLEANEKTSLTGVSFPSDMVRLPSVMDSVTEVWAREGKYRFLVGPTIWDEKRNPIVSVCTDTDEIEIVSFDQLKERLADMPFYLGVVEYRWYRS